MSATHTGAESAAESRPPRLLGELLIDYPTTRTDAERRLLSRGQGRVMQVVFQVLVGPDGAVQQLSIRRSFAPGSAYESAAEEAIRRASFEPGERDGRPAAMWTLVQVDFPDR